MPEKFDRLVAHIKREYEAKGYSPDRADAIAYATANKASNEQETDDTDADESAEEVSADE